ncbi:hypothetical protein KDK_63750 [Dictyobacter kobayashii]|uniref:Uncharacterized protein n=1 Tax=Dictyobacter kobayashii TaxID=2014872 RepID=A0A402AU30_9CHLR|nr:hypothetical protein KDK_63750 [Dictyobacter kobayashii]
MFPYNNQMISIMYLRLLMKESEERRIHTRHPKYFSWKRSGRLGARKLGILLMRIGGKLVYWGTPPYVPPLPDEVS